ncbi:MAG: hypothetical protein AB7V26_03295 [Lysobacterales bacterium]
MKTRTMVLALSMTLAVAILVSSRAARQDQATSAKDEGSRPALPATPKTAPTRPSSAPNPSSPRLSTAESGTADLGIVPSEAAYNALPDEERDYTPTSLAMAKWMVLHRFPTADAVAHADVDSLREKAEGECDMRAANTLIAALRQRGDAGWKSEAESWANSGGSLFAARALLHEELRKPSGKRDAQRVFSMAAMASALGAHNIYGTVMSGDSGALRLRDYGSDAAWKVLAAFDFTNAQLQEIEDRFKHVKHPYRFTNCTVVRALEPPHPWNSLAFERFLKLHPEYPR